MRLYRDDARGLWVIVGSTYEDAYALGRNGARFVFDRTGNKTGKPKSWYTDRLDKALKLRQFADDSCRDQLVEAHQERSAKVELSRAADSNFDVPCPEGLEPMPFQRGGVKFQSENTHTLLGDPMGLGKTIQILCYINWLERNGYAPNRVCGIVPASLKLNWEREARKWLTHDREIVVASGPKTKDHVDLCRYYDREKIPYLLIINYDITSQKSVYKITKEGEDIKLGAWDNFLREKEWDFLFFDEAHYLKSRKARRTVSALGRDAIRRRRSRGRVIPAQPAIPAIPATRVTMATGTPYPNRPIEIWPLLNRLSNEFGTYWAFAQRYCGAHNNGYGTDVSGCSNLDELQERLRSTILIRREKAEVLTELPPKTRQVIDLPENGFARIIGRERKALKNIRATIKKLRRNVTAAKGTEDYSQAVQALNEGRMVNLMEMSRIRKEMAIAKIPKVIEFVENTMMEVDKLVVFAHHRQVIEDLEAALRKSYGAVKLYGGMSAQAKQDAVDQFQNDPDCGVFIGQMTSAGVGLTLTAASHMLFAEEDWVPGNIFQAEARIDRIGQEAKHLHIVHLVVDGSLDSTMAKRVVMKQRAIEAGLDDDNFTLDIDPKSCKDAALHNDIAQLLGLETEA